MESQTTQRPLRGTRHQGQLFPLVDPIPVNPAQIKPPPLTTAGLILR